MTPPTERILTEAQIKSLLVRERYYRDTCQWKELRDCYHPDTSKTHIEITWFQGDIDGFVAGSESMATGGTSAVHTICPVEIRLHGKKALSESTGSISIRFQHAGEWFDCVSYTRFISRLELVDDEWKLLSLEAIYDRDFITPVIPQRTADFNFPDDTRESYKCISWVLAQKGFVVKQDLPGVDDSALSAQLMEASLTWLSK
ncbi:hypothetical protein BDV39DRAFT_215935 [Aspergillus sergii]|uniref:SnoaL-like domain-containing protein n=1 Tax=Aspergillus sergii TaxID=1034303 RepID=A0A5N6XKT0_9EURO|nr:hypothetical protein BDV39DRAFT_215935 [Aspergillus sergii]